MKTAEADIDRVADVPVDKEPGEAALAAEESRIMLHKASQ